MRNAIECLPTVQDMLWKCNRRILAESLCAYWPRMTSKTHELIVRAIDEMCDLEVGLPCDALPSGALPSGALSSDALPSDALQSEIVVLPREHFSAPLFGAFVRQIDVECLDLSQRKVPQRGIIGKPWEEVLSYCFWQGPDFTYYDVHDALALVVRGMMLTGPTQKDARANAALETMGNRHAEVNPPQHASAAESQPWVFASKAHTRQRVDLEELARIEQEVVLSRRLGEINKAADARFVMDARRLQEYLETAA